jgi:hypothetical protein
MDIFKNVHFPKSWYKTQKKTNILTLEHNALFLDSVISKVLLKEKNHKLKKQFRHIFCFQNICRMETILGD